MNHCLTTCFMTTSRTPLDAGGRGRVCAWKFVPAFGDTFVYGSTVMSRAQVTGTFATHDRFLDGFYVIGPTKLFVFRASYGDADPGV
jgi:hypothetical protein